METSVPLRPELIVPVAFDPDEEGGPARGFPAEFQSEDRAKRVAQALSRQVCRRDCVEPRAKPRDWRVRRATVLFQHDVPDLR